MGPFRTGCKRTVTCSSQQEAPGGVHEDVRVHGAQGNLHYPRALPSVRAAACLQGSLQGHILLQQIHLLQSTHSLIRDVCHTSRCEQLTLWAIISI